MTTSVVQPRDRVGLRAIAEAAGVCLMTVSLSLRHSPKISEVTRKRVHRIAHQLGYRPDPELSRLMRHLRTSRISPGTTGIALVDFQPEQGPPEHAYSKSIREGVAFQASRLGMSVSTFHGTDYRLNPARVLHVIRSRGINGIILLPSPVPMDFDSSLDWHGLSVVSTSNSIRSPRFHYIVPNQFGNMMRLIEDAQAKGCRKVGSIFDEVFDQRTHHHFTAALTWHGHGRRILVTPQDLPEAAKRKRITDWLGRHQPDAVFVQCDSAAETVRRLRGQPERARFRVMGLGPHNRGGFSYLDERADLIGIAAVDVLAGMITYHETGIPSHARTVLIEGELKPG
ncbi:MAG TPA: LacI family DNA-binding transcriptional regulator [Opitutaceae bacterium]|nr:LacI family DNA-binding transcriptional regulator [Opitutaceae bacterium]